jgi:hypothetical protein
MMLLPNDQWASCGMITKVHATIMYRVINMYHVHGILVGAPAFDKVRDTNFLRGTKFIRFGKLVQG